MDKNNKSKSIILFIGLVLILAVGVFLMYNRNDKESAEEGYSDSEIIGDEYHYVESFLGEEEWRYGYQRLMKYDDKIVKFAGEEKTYLTNLENWENVYEFDKTDFRAYEWWVSDDIFWNINYDEENELVFAHSFNADGIEKERISLKEFGGMIVNSTLGITQINITEEYIGLLIYNEGGSVLQVFNKEGELKSSFDDVKSFDVDSKGNCVYTKQTGFHMVDLATGKEIFSNDTYILLRIRFSDDGDAIYGYGTKPGSPLVLNTFDVRNGQFLESIFDLRKYASFFLEGYVVEDFLVLENGDIYFVIIDREVYGEFEDISKIHRYYYRYSREMGERPKSEVAFSIRTPYRYDFLEEAIKLYELKYPEHSVEYNYAYNRYEDFLENSEEYGAKLALDIIQGDIEDIVQVGGSGIQYQNILRTDAFADLTEFILNDKNYENLNKNVLNAIKINNAIRALPVTHTCYQYELNEDLEEQLGLDVDFNNMSWSELLDTLKLIEKNAPNNYLFTHHAVNESAWEMFGYNFVLSNMPDLVNLERKEVNLNQEWFKDLLIKFKEASKSKNFVFLDKDPNFFDKLKGALIAMVPPRERFYGDMLSEFNRYNEENRSRIIPSFTGEKNNNRIGYSMRMYSINNRSERKEEAWKFLSFLLGEDVQFIDSQEKVGTPINEKGIDKMAEYAKWMHGLSGENVERFNKAFKENSKKLDYLYDMGPMRQELLDSIQLYMDDKAGLDEVLKIAEERIIIMLNE